MSNTGTKYLGPEKFFLLFICEIDLKINVYKQECIPVGCVPPTRYS